MSELIQIQFEKLQSNVVDFINLELNKCRFHNIKITIPKVRGVVHDGVTCSGYFEEDPLEFVVATGRSPKFWFSTFVHESCHMDQWIESIPIWNQKINSKDPLDLIDLWVTNEVSLDDKTLADAIDIALEIELDCEKRSVEKIKEYNLPIKIETYIKKSNAYVWSYRFLKETRNWDHTALYEIPAVWRAMPKHFDNDYSILPDNIKNVFYNNIENLLGH